MSYCVQRPLSILLLALRQGSFSGCDTTNNSEVEGMLYGQKTGGFHGAKGRVSVIFQTEWRVPCCLECWHVYALDNLGTRCHTTVFSIIACECSWHSLLCPNAFVVWQLACLAAGYSDLTGGYEGGQAEYARVPFGESQLTLE